MAKTVVVSNAAHKQLVQLAKAEKRKIGGMAEVLIANALMAHKNAPIDACDARLK